MKKLLLAMMLFAAGGAFAQVSVFGNFDQTAYHSRQNGKTVSSIASNANTVSNWGIKGTEDLGQGLKANFTLISEISAMTGQTGSAATGISNTNSNKPQLFNRGAWLGLSSNYGEFRAGRQSDAWYESTLAVNNTGGASFGFNNVTAAMGNVGSHANITGVTPVGLSNLGTSTRNYTNSGTAVAFYGGVSYTSPKIFNTTVKLQTGQGKPSYADGSDIGGGSAYSAKYDNGTISAVVASTWKNDTNGVKAFTNTLVGGNYKTRGFTFTAAQNKTTFGGLATANHDMVAKAVGVGYDVSSRTNVAVGYTVLSDSDNANNKFKQTGVTARYKLSNRTTLYGGVAHGVNEGASKMGVVYAQAASDAGANVNAAILGLRYQF